MIGLSYGCARRHVTMLPIRRFVRVPVLNARQQNQHKCFSTVSDSDAKHGDKPYPLEGIRVLDLTRIGNNIFHYKLKRKVFFPKYCDVSLLSGASPANRRIYTCSFCDFH